MRFCNKSCLCMSDGDCQANNPLTALHAAIALEGSQVAFAKKHGFSSAFIGQVAMGRQGMSERLAKVLGFEKRVEWVLINKEKLND